MRKFTPLIAFAVAGVIAVGTISVDVATAQDTDIQKKLEMKEKELEELRARLATMEKSMDSSSSNPGFINPELLPPSAKPGECYARVFVPPTYKTEEVTVMQKEAGEKLEVIPAKYEWVTEQVLVREAEERLEIVPATYEWVEERVLVKDEQKIIEDVAPVYETVTEKVLVRAAHTVWKKGSGPVERVDDATGEIMCLVEVPDEYKTVTKRVLKSPATTREKTIPAEYKTVRKQVVKSPATTKKVSIPAKYDTVKVRKMVTPPSTRKIEIPATYDKVTKRIQVTDGKMDWRPILCETNLGHATVYEIQRSLKAKGFNPGDVDGVIGSQTLNAVRSFQRANNLAVGALTMETIRALGVKVG